MLHKRFETGGKKRGEMDFDFSNRGEKEGGNGFRFSKQGGKEEGNGSRFSKFHEVFDVSDTLSSFLAPQAKIFGFPTVVYNRKT